jgi:hypothetical protein
MTKFISASCRRKKCWCGTEAAHKVVEHIFSDDTNPNRRPLATFLCHPHFCRLMAVAAVEALTDRPVPPLRSGPKVHQEAESQTR